MRGRFHQHLAVGVAAGKLQFVEADELVRAGEQDLVEELAVLRVLVIVAHDGRRFDGGEEMVAQMLRHAVPVEHADVVPPTCLHDERAVVMEDVPAAIAAEVQPVADEPHARQQRVVIAARGHGPVGMPRVLPHEGEVGPVAAVGGDRVAFGSVEAHVRRQACPS